MVSIIGSVAFGFVAVLTVCLCLGAPLGEFTMGGQHKVRHHHFGLLVCFHCLLRYLEF